MAKVMVAMSGGVDSSLSAALLKDQGHRVVGVTLRLLPEAAEPRSSSHPCCLTQDVDDARAVCNHLGIPYYVLNYQAQFQSLVIGYCIRQYMTGRTPNPCLRCNQEMKFNFLLRQALALGLDYVATGHYARIHHANSSYRLLRGKDFAKDQSYFLYTLGQGELPYLLFPLGEYTKVQVRALARERGLPVAEKAESQDACFAPQGLRAFLAGRVEPLPGDIVHTRGEVLGRHPGVAYYTVGQRRGLGLASSQPNYVVRLDPQQRWVVVGGEAELYASWLHAVSVSWAGAPPISWPLQVAAQVRYRAPAAEAEVYPWGDGVAVAFAQPQRALAPGQAVVFYQGEEVLGGGIIQGVLPNLIEPNGSEGMA